MFQSTESINQIKVGHLSPFPIPQEKNTYTFFSIVSICFVGRVGRSSQFDLNIKSSKRTAEQR